MIALRWVIDSFGASYGERDGCVDDAVGKRRGRQRRPGKSRHQAIEQHSSSQSQVAIK